MAGLGGGGGGGGAAGRGGRGGGGGGAGPAPGTGGGGEGERGGSGHRFHVGGLKREDPVARVPRPLAHRPPMGSYCHGVQVGGKA